MRTFKKPNLSNGWKCPICGTSEEKEVVLLGIRGTEKDNIMQAEQFHLECIDLIYYKADELIAQKIGGRA